MRPPLDTTSSISATLTPGLVLVGDTGGARYLGVHVERMPNWARKGVIPAAKLGNRGGFRFRREDLDRFLEARREEGR